VTNFINHNNTNTKKHFTSKNLLLAKHLHEHLPQNWKFMMQQKWWNYA